MLGSPMAGEQASEAAAVAALADRLANVQARIEQAARRASRDPAGITLVAVSKTQSAQTAAALAAAGQGDFGENRIEEAGPKMLALGSSAQIRWHMIGHIQGRKAREVVQTGFTLLHSVDTLRLAQKLSRHAQEAGRRQAVLLECNVSGEAAKAGFAASDPNQWAALLPEFELIAGLLGLEVRGLMAMAPQVAEPALARPHFERLAALRGFLRDRLQPTDWAELSMGMTDDFEPAIEAGATLVRIGRAIFGDRP